MRKKNFNSKLDVQQWRRKKGMGLDKGEEENSKVKKCGELIISYGIGHLA